MLVEQTIIVKQKHEHVYSKRSTWGLSEPFSRFEPVGGNQYIKIARDFTYMSNLWNTNGHVWSIENVSNTTNAFHSPI